MALEDLERLPETTPTPPNHPRVTTFSLVGAEHNFPRTRSTAILKLD